MTEATFRPLDSLQVMAYIIQRCKQLQTPFLNTTKLQKLMYCCYGTCLAKWGVSGFLCLGRLFQGQPNEAALCFL